MCYFINYSVHMSVLYCTVLPMFNFKIIVFFNDQARKVMVKSQSQIQIGIMPQIQNRGSNENGNMLLTKTIYHFWGSLQVQCQVLHFRFGGGKFEGLSLIARGIYAAISPDDIREMFLRFNCQGRVYGKLTF